MKYSVVHGRSGAECDLESTFCTNSFCSHPCEDCGFTFDEAKAYVLDYYESKTQRLVLMTEEDWSNY